MEKYTRVASIKDIPPGKGVLVKLNNELVALFNHSGKIYAIQNRCPHQNADLADGYIRNNQVYCPMHNWAFDLETGAFAFNPEQKLKTYSVELRDNEIYIMIDKKC